MALPGQEDIDITLKMGSDNQHVVGGGLRQGVRVGGERGRRSVAVVDRQGRLCGWTWMTDCHFVDGEEGRGGGRDSEERPRGHWRDDQDSHQDNSRHEQAREPRTSLE